MIRKPEITRPKYEEYAPWKIEDRHLMDTKGVRYIVLHHDGSEQGHLDNEAVAIHRYHVNTLEWAAIGYHFWIRWDGSIRRGRPLDVRGAHAGSEYNDRSWGIGFAGHFGIGEPTEEQWEAGLHLVSWLLDYAPVDSDLISVVGHDELRGGWRCPGDNFDMDRFRTDLKEWSNGSAVDEIKALRRRVDRLEDQLRAVAKILKGGE